jgi:hypothetical protein
MFKGVAANVGIAFEFFDRKKKTFTFVPPLAQKPVKKAIAAFMLLIVLFNAMGYHVLFQVNRYLIRKEMRAVTAAKPRKVVVLEIRNASSDPDFQRIHSREFRYKGRMYDIVREVKKGGVTTFYCLRDTKEENLLAGFRKMNHDKKNQVLRIHLITQALTGSGMILTPPAGEPYGYPELKPALTCHVFKPGIPPPKLS